MSDDNDNIIWAVDDIGVDENKTCSTPVVWTAVDKAGNSAQISREVVVYNVVDAAIKVSFSGICTFVNNSYIMEFTEAKSGDTINCLSILNKK